MSDSVGPCAYQPFVLSGAGSVAVVTGSVRSMCRPETVAEVELPALSSTLSLALRLSPSPATSESAGQEPAIPDNVSEHVQCTKTSWLYQPSSFGWVVTAPLMLGAVSSTLMPATLVEALLPAASVAVPAVDWPAPS